MLSNLWAADMKRREERERAENPSTICTLICLGIDVMDRCHWPIHTEVASTCRIIVNMA